MTNVCFDRRTVLRRRRQLGAWQDDFERNLRAGIASADPELAEVVDLASEIVTLERRPGGALDPASPSTFRVSDLKRPLKAYLFYRKHPLVAYAIPVGILALAFLVGRASATNRIRQETR